MTADLAVEVRGLCKSYGTTRAVDGLDLEVEQGETLAVLGPNGAGKTTTIEILEGFRRADAGTARVLGLDPWSEGSRLKARIGIMLQEGGVYLTMTPREALGLFSRFYACPRDPEELVTLVGLQEAAVTPFRRLSGGQKQRLNLALALLPRPDLVFLDEPTSGMDPQARRATWEIIGTLKAEGVTVVLTTHYLEEAERLADRVAIVNAGRLVALDRPSALASSDRLVRVRTVAPVDLGVLSALPAAHNARLSGDTYVLETDDAPSLLAEVTARLLDVGVPVRELRVGGGNLEETYLRLTGGEGE